MPKRSLLMLVALGAAWLGHSLVDVNQPASSRAAEKDAAPDFKKAGVAFLEKHCIQCHGDKMPKAEVKLSIYKDDVAVIRDRKVWQNVLMMVQSGEMPPKKRPRPAAAEVEAFVQSVTGVFARADRNSKSDPGRVTIRRLNRAEYNNTIRDLVGVDFNPAEDFPSDDIGHGFDNIGDVLSLSPVLMERYLAAAESIVQRAIVLDPPKPMRRNISSRYTEPSRGGDITARFRAISTKPSKLATETGPVSTSYTPSQVPADGAYVFRSRVYAQAEGGGPVRIAVLACGKTIDKPATDAEVAQLWGLAVPNLRPFVILKTIEVKADSDKTAETIEVKVPPLLGFNRTALALCKPPEGKTWTLHLENLSLEGPLDPPRPATHRRLLACSPGKPKAEQTREVLARFASKAYRRPATTDEVDRLVKLAEAAEARGDKWEAAVQLAIQAVLVSPKFLFRVELDDRPDRPEPYAIDEFQLASRLSYFLWSTMPDDELFDLAGKKQLSANLDAQVRRMLRDPRSKSLVDNFVMQWLQLRRLRTFAPDPKLFPMFDERLRAAMLKETELFFDAIIREDRSILDLIDGDFTFLNERLARHYGIIDTVGTQMGKRQPARPGGQPIRGEPFVRVQLTDGMRGGLLTQASILTVTSNPTRTSPVKRGRWVLEQLLGTPPPPPPPNVPELAEGEKAVLSGSLRQRMEQHRANPSCANCHARMDPLGFAFENYNAIGGFRLKDGDFAIDPSGTLPDGKSFKGPAELRVILKDKKESVSRCLAEKLLTFAAGRGLEYYDKAAIDKIVAALERDGHRFSTLVIEIAQSDPFRMRRGSKAAR